MRTTTNQIGGLRGFGAFACGLLALLTVLSGCENNAPITGTSKSPLPKEEDSAAFLDRVSSMESVSENDAMRGILMLLDGDDTAASFQHRVQALKDRGIVDRSWDFVADRPMTRGKYAYMIFQAIKMPGGVILTLTGPSQRYCLRELQYRQVMVDASRFGEITGMEYVAVLGRADVYKRTGKVPDLAGDIEER